MSVRVLQSTADAMPKVVRFSFASVLEDPMRGWLIWLGRAPERWTPPAIGEHAVIAGAPLLRSLTLW